MNHIQMLQEDLRWQEEFIGEIAKYDRELAEWVLEGMATGDEEVMSLLEQMGLIKAMGAGARAGDAAMKGLGFSGRVSDFLSLRAPGKVAGALGAGAIYAGKKLLGGGSGTEKKKEQPAKPGMGERIKGAVDALRGNAASSSSSAAAGSGSGGGGGGGGGPINISINNQSTGGSNVNTNTQSQRVSQQQAQQQIQGGGGGSIRTQSQRTPGGSSTPAGGSSTPAGDSSSKRRGGSSSKPAPPPAAGGSSSKPGVDTSIPVHPREKARMDAEKAAKGGSSTPAEGGSSTSRSRRIGSGYGGSRDEWDRAVVSKEDQAKAAAAKDAGVVKTAEKLTDSGTTAKGTVGRTVTNVDAARVSGGEARLAAATSNTFNQRVKNVASEVTGAAKARNTDPNRPMTAEDERRVAGATLKPKPTMGTRPADAPLTDPEKRRVAGATLKMKPSMGTRPADAPLTDPEKRRVAGATLKMKPSMGTRPADAPPTDPEKRRVAGSTIGREATATAIRNADARAARATVGRAATNIAARGVNTSPESVGSASTVSGEMRDSGASPKDAAKAVTSALRKPSARRGARPSRMTAQGRADRSERNAAEAETARESRRERISAMASRRRQTGGNPSAGLRTTATGTGTFSPGARRPGKGASGTQMGLFGG